MKIHKLISDKVEVGITEECGHLFPVKFKSGSKVFQPMHVSPWFEEQFDDSTPPMLRYLRGDFFCAPFGDSNILPDENRGHGASANDKWNLVDKRGNHLKLQLSKKISGAELVKEINVKENHPAVYQKHTFTGGSGEIPVGHHAMLKINSKAFISFSEFEFAGTPPLPIETDTEKGRSILKYPQTFSNISLMKSNDGNVIDASLYPFDSGHEDLYMVISKKNLQFGWSAVSCPDEGWLWFSLKNVKDLPNTVVWLSNGGRYYPPFSSRHKNVIGIEETLSFFHLGHKASVENNFLNGQGYKTSLLLKENQTVSIPYIFGAAEIPGHFGKVKNIIGAENGIQVEDINNNRIKIKIDLSFIR